MIVRGATPDHAGLYTCTAGQFGAGEGRAEIVIGGGNEGGDGGAPVIVTPSKLTIKPGGTAELMDINMLGARR